MTPSRFAERDGLRLAIYEWGAAGPDRPTVVLIHGYPDAAECWSGVASVLEDRYHVVAYDVRGAGRSDSPSDTSGYRLGELAEDFRAVIDVVSPDAPVHLVGHDWGGLQAWEAVQTPAIAGRVASLSAFTPALDHVGRWFRYQFGDGGPRGWVIGIGQALSSSYMAALCVPAAPELIWQLVLGRRWAGVVRRLEGVDLEPRDTQVRDGQCGVGLYRANLFDRLRHPRPARVDVPVQLLLMTGDRFVPSRLFGDVEAWAPVTTRVELDGGHWAHLADPTAAATAIDRHITQTLLQETRT